MNRNKPSESAPAIDRAFLNIATAHKGGAMISEISAAIKQVTSAVQLTGRPGKVLLQMTLRPASKGTAGTLVFEAKVKATAPELDATGSIFYADDDFNLVREDPNQKKLDLRVVETEGQQQAEPLRKAVAQ